MTLRRILDRLPGEARGFLLEGLLKTVLKSKNAAAVDQVYVRRFLSIARESLLESSEGLEVLLYMALAMEKEKTLSLLSEKPEFKEIYGILSG